ncbi:hypothetical protein CCP3SC15_3520001 [Gammaproteobacteria bacterium]
MWKQGGSGKEFSEAAEARGYILARGEKRPFVVVDEQGKAHNLARQIEGVKTAELRARLEGVKLPSVEEATARQVERLKGERRGIEAEQQKNTVAAEQTPTLHADERAKAELTEAWRKTDGGSLNAGRDFVSAMTAKGYRLAQGFGEFVAMDRDGGAHRLSRSIEGADSIAIRKRMEWIDRASLPTILEVRLERRAQAEQAAKRPEPARLGGVDLPSVEEATRPRGGQPLPAVFAKAANVGVRVADSVANGVTSAADKLLDLFVGGTPKPRPRGRDEPPASAELPFPRFRGEG